MRTELTSKVLLQRFREQGGVVERTRDGHLKLYAPLRTAEGGAGLVLIGKLATTGNSANEANKRGLISVRASMRRSGFDV